MTYFTIRSWLALITYCLIVMTQPASAQSATEQCLLDALQSSDASASVADVRAQCTPQASQATEIHSDAQSGVLKQRIAAEAAIIERPFALTAHRPNYILPYTYNDRPNVDSFRLINPDAAMDNAEAQFQVSFKFPLMQKFQGPGNDLFFAFTTRAWWQVYNDNISSPFRETDYEPELIFRHYGGAALGPVKIAGWDLGVAHQSNGQSRPLSRSWNRVNANLALEAGNLALALRSWYRIPEGADDDNPHLHRYLGYGDIRLLYNRHNHVVSAMFRPGTDKSAFEFTWSMPLWQQLRLYLVYFDGYGENLLDYDHHSRRIGVGIGLNDYVDVGNDSR